MTERMPLSAVMHGYEDCQHTDDISKMELLLMSLSTS